MGWRIEFTETAKKQVKKLGGAEARRVLDYLRDRVAVADDPRQLGKSLKGQLSELWRYRVGDHRVICELQDQKLVVLVVRIGHRKDVYR